MKLMNNRHIEILHAARVMFARYGYAKTTMADIAAEAGVARQTVYNAYARKDDILRAAVRLTGEEAIEAICQTWDTGTTLDEKLTIFLNLGPLAWFKEMRAAPDWAELMDGLHKAASEELSELERTWREALSDMLRSHYPEQDLPDERWDEFAEFFYAASVNSKHGVRDIEHLQSRLNIIKAATIALIEKEAVN